MKRRQRSVKDVETNSAPNTVWPHPCNRQDIRAIVLALAALEKLRRDRRLRPREYLEWRREFLFGLVAALEANPSMWFTEADDLPQGPRRHRAQKQRAK